MDVKTYFITPSGIASLIAILLVVLTWYIWRSTIRIYAEFPSCSFSSDLIYISLIRKPDVPYTARVFNSIINKLKAYESEGLCLVWMLKPMLFIFCEEAVQVFSNENAAIDKNSCYKALESGFGKGLSTSKGETWRKHRKLFNPAFYPGMLKEKISILNKHAEALVKKLEEESEKPSLNLINYIKTCAFSIVYESMLHIKADTPEKRGEIENIVENISKLSPFIVYRMLLPWLHYDFILQFFASGRRFKRRLNETKIFIRKNVDDLYKSIKSRKAPGIDSNDLNKPGTSFTHILFDIFETDSSLTTEYVQEEVRTFIAAGYDTVTYTMMWCLFLLGLHADIQEQVHSELEEALSGKYITYEDLYKLQFLDCVIKETLRLYPAVPLYARHLNKEVQCGKYKVPKGTDVVFCPYILHRNADIYSDPEKFDPLRFSGDKSVKTPWSYIPFSEGVRSCIGKKFAQLEMKVVLAHIIRNFKITSLDKREDVVLSWEIVLAPVKPLRFRLSPRHQIDISKK